MPSKKLSEEQLRQMEARILHYFHLIEGEIEVFRDLALSLKDKDGRLSFSSPETMLLSEALEKISLEKRLLWRSFQIFLREIGTKPSPLN